ncbi:MAG TPA: autotransporter-associated beta strand repeat-containing protein, partial [Luteolibacter sp.]
NGVIANGVDKTADFSALNLSADTTVTLDGARTVGGLTFGDTTPSHSWVLNTGSGGPLTLAVSSGAPAINVIHTRFAIINAVIAGTKGFIKTGAGALWLTGANTYTGVTTVSGGMIQVSGNQPAANGGWAINGNTIVNLLTGSSVAVASGKSIDFANTSGNYHSMTVGGAVTNAGSLTMGGASGLTISAGGNWSQSGAIMLAPNWSYEIARINVNVGGTFTYTGGTDIELRTNNAAPGVSDTSVLNLSGGTFTTGKGFINNISGVNATNGSANLWFSNGGVLKLTANITTLATTATRPFNVQLGMGGGKIDTNGFTTTITQGIANISGQIGSLSKQGLGTLTLSGASTYTGATTVEGGTLAITGSLANTAVEVKGSAKLTAGGSLGGAVTIRPNGHLGFVLAATPGAQPARTIGGVLTLDAGNILDFSAAATPAVGVYVLATASSISGTPGTVNLPAGVTGAVTVVGNSLRLTITPPGYSAWIAIYSVGGETAANDDADQDGLPNAVEFVLGTDPTHASGSGITAQSSGGNFIVTFHRSDASESSGLQLFVEGGPLPGSSSQVLAIGASSSSNVSVIENSTAPDTVIVTLPTGGASKFFARLKVVITGS